MRACGPGARGREGGPSGERRPPGGGREAAEPARLHAVARGARQAAPGCPCPSWPTRATSKSSPKAGWRRAWPSRATTSAPAARASSRSSRAGTRPRRSCVRRAGPCSCPPCPRPPGSPPRAGRAPPAPPASLMVVPLRARGRLIGLLSLGSLDSGRRYAPADLALAEELAHRAAIALDNARSYQAMQRAVRQRQDVLAVVSHDLRTPLGAILMADTLLPDQCDDGGEGAARRKTLDMIARSVAQMDRLIKDLLDMSSIDRRRRAWSGRRPNCPRGA
ncbi:MAG TPA: histidine kinase dimerization/phospho-acceptor domain-containing protein [Polyangiaceae bacterium]|nr:histidine kinase dimerization/phospho-acceptor domain-containing protein [Polyangiaceae bacterium]